MSLEFNSKKNLNPKAHLRNSKILPGGLKISMTGGTCIVVTTTRIISAFFICP